MDNPPELLEAEAQIARGLGRRSEDVGWLQARARVDLFEGRYEPAIDALRQVQTGHPEDVSVKLDLAIAYYVRAGTHSEPAAQAADYGLVLQSLNEVLNKNPNDVVALFDRAMVYAQLKRYPESTSDWKHYLQLDPAGAWAEVAKRQAELVSK
jgi:Flp pilus assembly protein TadD